MKPASIAFSILGLVAILAPAPARAQQSGTGGTAPSVNHIIDLRPELTKGEFAEFTAELGSALRFRQLGDARTLARGDVDVSVEFASAAIDTANRSVSFPRIVGRFGVSDRVDIGAWGGLNTSANYGLVGGDAKIVLLRGGPARPVTLSIRPSLTTLVGPSEVFAASASIDLTVSRAFGAVSPYAGVATTASAAMERSTEVDLDPATAEGSVAYAGLSYHWRTVVMSAEMEKGTQVSYAFRLGTRF
jgi:hypothetical protein